MTTYTGTGAQVFMTALDFDKVEMGEDDVTAVTLTIYDADGLTPFPSASEVTMPWNEEQLGWLYLWDSGATPVGVYEGQVTMHFPTGPPEVEFVKVHVKQRKAGVAT